MGFVVGNDGLVEEHINANTLDRATPRLIATAFRVATGQFEAANNSNRVGSFTWTPLNVKYAILRWIFSFSCRGDSHPRSAGIINRGRND